VARLLATLHTTGVDYVDHFAARVIQDALMEAEAAYWSRRAMALLDARPRPGDYAGHATKEQLRERHSALSALAATYQARARALEETQ
jgi:hypothetical protein